MEDLIDLEELRVVLKACFQARNPRPSHLAKELGIEHATLTRFAKGEQRGVNRENYIKLSKWMQQPSLLPKSGDVPAIRRIGEHSPAEYVKGPHTIEVPFRSVVEAGRMGIEVFELAPSRLIPILQRYYRDGLNAFEVDSASMEPTIKKGAVIGVIPLDGALIEGEMYIIKRPHFGMLVKRAYMGQDKLILKSDNKDFEPLTLPYIGYEQATVILGRVVWIWQDV